MEAERKVPGWLLTTEEYEVQRDREGFLTRSILKLTGLLSRVREGNSLKEGGASPQIRLIYTLLLIILASCSHNMIFTYCILAGLLVRLCFLRGKQLASVIKTAVGATLLSMLLLLPAVFLGSPKSMLTISLKVFLSVGLIMLLAGTTPWNKITAGLRSFRVPGIIIFTFDITLKYIALLGEICLNALQALRLRSVGKNEKKDKTFGGVLGTAFLKSRQMTDEMYDAMVCRGYDGEFTLTEKYRFRKMDLAGIGLMIAAIVLFIYLQFFV